MFMPWGESHSWKTPVDQSQAPAVRSMQPQKEKGSTEVLPLSIAKPLAANYLMIVLSFLSAPGAVVRYVPLESTI
jgi:hypothetical protein